MNLLAKVNTGWNWTNSVLAVAAGALIPLMMLVICGDVLMRYFFNRPMTWVLETAEYMLLWMTFLGAIWLLEKEGHVRMDLVLNRLKPENQALLNAITSILGVIACFAIAFYKKHLCQIMATGPAPGSG